jgi:hypothetical protein
MGVIVIRTQTLAPPAGGGPFTATPPAVGTSYNVQGSSPNTPIQALYGDWAFAIVTCRSGADLPTFPGWRHTTGWTYNVFGHSIAGALGTNILYAQLGGFLQSPDSTGSGSTAVAAAVFVVVDNKPPVTVGGNLMHQYVLEGGVSVLDSAGTSLALPSFAPASPKAWNYHLITCDGNYGTTISGFDTPWILQNDTIFPSWARYDIPNPAGPTLAPPALSITAGITAAAMAFSDDGTSYTADRIFGARRARPEPPRVAQEQGGGITIS